MLSHEERTGSVMGLFVRLGDQLGPQTQEIVYELVDHNESGLALEIMADLLAESGASIGDGKRAEMLELVSALGMDDRVERSLHQCPRSD